MYPAVTICREGPVPDWYRCNSRGAFIADRAECTAPTGQDELLFIDKSYRSGLYLH